MVLSLVLAVLALGSVVDGPIQTNCYATFPAAQYQSAVGFEHFFARHGYATDVNRRSGGREPEVILTVTTTFVGGVQLDRLMRQKLPKTVLRPPAKPGASRGGCLGRDLIE
jgi:hypothetical protein